MMNVEITAVVKYAWAALVPAFYKGWNILDQRFEDNERKINVVGNSIGEIKTDIRLIDQKLDQKIDQYEKLSDKVDKIYDKMMSL